LKLAYITAPHYNQNQLEKDFIFVSEKKSTVAMLLEWEQSSNGIHLKDEKE